MQDLCKDRLELQDNLDQFKLFLEASRKKGAHKVYDDSIEAEGVIAEIKEIPLAEQNDDETQDALIDVICNCELSVADAADAELPL